MLSCECCSNHLSTHTGSRSWCEKQLLYCHGETKKISKNLFFNSEVRDGLFNGWSNFTIYFRLGWIRLRKEFSSLPSKVTSEIPFQIEKVSTYFEFFVIFEGKRKLNCCYPYCCWGLLNLQQLTP